MAFDPDAYLAKHDPEFNPDEYLAKHEAKAPVNLHRMDWPSDEQAQVDQAAARNSPVDAGRRDATLERDLSHIPSTVRSPEASKWLKGHKNLVNNPLAEDWIGQGIVGQLMGGAAGKVIAPAAKYVGPGLARIGQLFGEGAVNTGVQGGNPMAGGGIGLLTGAVGAGGRGIMKSRGAASRQFIEEHGGNVGLGNSGSGPAFDEMVPGNLDDAHIGRQSIASSRAGLESLHQKDIARRAPIGAAMDAMDASPEGQAYRTGPEVSDMHENFVERSNQIGAPKDTKAINAEAAGEIAKANEGRNLGRPTVTIPLPVGTTKADIEQVLGKPMAQANRFELEGAAAEIAKNRKAAATTGVVPQETVTASGPAEEMHIREADLNRLRRTVSNKADVGVSVSGRKAGGRTAAAELRQAVDQGPYAPLNQQYSVAKHINRRDRRLLGISDRRTGGPSEGAGWNRQEGTEESEGAVEKVANLIGRRRQNTTAAGKSIDRLSKFEKLNPDIGEEFAKPAMLSSKADLQFGILPQGHGGFFDRTSRHMMGGAATGALASLASGGHTSGAHALAALAGALTLRNMNAINGRILYNPARAAVAAAHSKFLPPLLFQAAAMNRGNE